MIEQYFEKGLTYTWIPPTPISTQPKDGAIVQSGNNTPPPLTYTGNNSVVLPYAGPPPAHFGLVPNMVIPYRWVNYVHGRTAYLLSHNTDVLTGPMSGCWICKWTEQGQRHVGHVGTVESAGKHEHPNSTVKTTFGNHTALTHSHLRACRPSKAWTMDQMMVHSNRINEPRQGFYLGLVMSLVTTADRFFALLLFGKNGTNEWVCAGKKEVTPIHRPEFLRHLR
jgi:hypothetical protein